MAILIESYSVVIRDDAFRTPAQREQFLRELPAGNYCSDGLLHRVPFMDTVDVEKYCHYLEKDLGLRWLDDRGWVLDFVVIDMLTGPYKNCEWVNYKREPVFAHREDLQLREEDFSIAWHKDEFGGIPERYAWLGDTGIEIGVPAFDNGIVAPHDWRPENANLKKQEAEERDDLEVIDKKGGIVTLRNTKTGEITYQGQPSVKSESENELYQTAQQMFFEGKGRKAVMDFLLSQGIPEEQAGQMATRAYRSIKDARREALEQAGSKESIGVIRWLLGGIALFVAGIGLWEMNIWILVDYLINTVGNTAVILVVFAIVKVFRKERIKGKNVLHILLVAAVLSLLPTISRYLNGAYG